MTYMYGKEAHDAAELKQQVREVKEYIGAIPERVAFEINGLHKVWESVTPQITWREVCGSAERFHQYLKSKESP